MTISPPRVVSGPLLLWDIGGYTAFLQAVAGAHADDAFAGGNVPPAYAILSSLLGGIVESVVPPLTLAKLEGDAVFVYAADDGPVPRGADLLAWLAASYAGFEERLGQARDLWSCSCEACIRLDFLDLKAILHAGPFVLGGIAGREELSGAEVVLAHRLLKSSAAAVAETTAYALLTSAAVKAYGVPTTTGRPMTEAVEHFAPVECVVFDLRATT